jgi:hypothetical protein
MGFIDDFYGVYRRPLWGQKRLLWGSKTTFMGSKNDLYGVQKRPLWGYAILGQKLDEFIIVFLHFLLFFCKTTTLLT